MTVWCGARVVTPGGIVEDGWVEIADGVIVAVGGGGDRPVGRDAVGGAGDRPVGRDAVGGAGDRPVGRDEIDLAGERPVRRDEIDLAGAWVLPGFVDLHVHGGGGSSFDGTTDDIGRAIEFHRAHGTTALLASVATAPIETMVAATARLADLIDRAGGGDELGLVGIHLEGPFLARSRCGAQDPEAMLDPDPDVLKRLLGAGGGHVRIVTVAPERPRALALIDGLVERGVIAAIGHTDATAEVVESAIAAGARLATHLGNGMPPFHHRQPGPVGVCLGSAEIVGEVIADGEHLHPATVRMFAAALGRDRLALVTDAVAAAGLDDGRHPWGRREVIARDGVVRLIEPDGRPGALAGSTLTTVAAVRHVVEWGLPIETAARAAARTPARLLGLADRGTVEAGQRADLVLLDDDLAVLAVVVGGRVVAGGWPRN